MPGGDDDTRDDAGAVGDDSPDCARPPAAGPGVEAAGRNGTNGDRPDDLTTAGSDDSEADVTVDGIDDEQRDDVADVTTDATDATDDHGDLDDDDDDVDDARDDGPDEGGERVLVGASTAPGHEGEASVRYGPKLPFVEAKPPPPMYRAVATPMPGSATWYRTDQDRYKSVHRRANPWFRRLARGIIGFSFLAALGVGLFLGARLVQDYLDRDRLPSIGAEVPEIRATSFEVRSTAPAPIVDGTITLDATSGAFEFVGRGTGPQAGTQLVSPDGATVFVRFGSGSWELADGRLPVAADVRRAVSYLRDDDSADAILTSQIRRGYVDLVDRVEVGEGDDEIRRYQLRLDTDSFDADFPLQFRQFQDRALPGVTAVRALPLTIAVDDEGVLVEVNDETSNWSWQRLTYSDQPFRPLDPADQLLTDTIEITDGNVDG